MKKIFLILLLSSTSIMIAENRFDNLFDEADKDFSKTTVSKDFRDEYNKNLDEMEIIIEQLESIDSPKV